MSLSHTHLITAQTDKFTGADLTEICQRAAKLAIREDIEKNMERERIRNEAREQGLMDEDVEDEDLVPEIMPRHFELAVREARRSVSDNDLAQYSRFAQNLQQSRSQMTAGGGSLNTFSFPQAASGSSSASAGAAAAADDEEDLYS